MSTEDFITNLPIYDVKYALLMSEDGLNGYKIIGGYSGNLYIGHKPTERNVLSLKEDTKSQIIKELNENCFDVFIEKTVRKI